MRELARTVKVSPLEKISGARGDRAELAKALKRLEGGDTLIVTRLDRLARSTRDLLNILHSLSQNDVSFKSLHDVWADTTSAHGRLMLTILGGLAEFERELILASDSLASSLGRTTTRLLGPLQILENWPFTGKLLKDMGYERVYNLGGFKDWADAGGEVKE